MNCHEIAQALVLDPVLPTPRCPPPVDDVRPCCCPHCGALARREGRVVLESNGPRDRPVVVPRLEAGQVVLLRETCWARRFLCNACGKSTLVLPKGVVPGCLFSLPALVWAWMLLHPLLGASQAHGEDCAAEATDRAEQPPAKRRWRLPYRWSKRIAGFWPSADGPACGWLDRVGRVLVELGQRAMSWDPVRLLRVAAMTHTPCGGPA